MRSTLPSLGRRLSLLGTHSPHPYSSARYPTRARARHGAAKSRSRSSRSRVSGAGLRETGYWINHVIGFSEPIGEFDTEV
jgi:hypothetical protein